MALSRMHRQVEPLVCHLRQKTDLEARLASAFLAWRRDCSTAAKEHLLARAVKAEDTALKLSTKEGGTFEKNSQAEKRLLEDMKLIVEQWHDHAVRERRTRRAGNVIEAQGRLFDKHISFILLHVMYSHWQRITHFAARGKNGELLERAKGRYEEETGWLRQHLKDAEQRMQEVSAENEELRSLCMETRRSLGLWRGLCDQFGGPDEMA